MEHKIGIVDIETTGFLNKGACIVEIGIASLDLRNGNVEKVFDSLLREKTFVVEQTVTPFGWIFKNSSLTILEARKAPPAESVFAEAQLIMDQFPLGLTAYNKSFDFDYLEDRGLTINQLDCPMKLATPIVKAKHRNGRRGNKWPSVEEAWAYFFPNDPYIEEHRGADDAMHEAKIVYELFKMGVFKVPGFDINTK